MRNIVTKSIIDKKAKSDGLRICVMRRIHPEYDFDIWIPKLAPSEKLLKEYVINKTISWEEFSRKYKSLVVRKNTELIKLLVEISLKRKITLLCSEESPMRCHRRLIIEACAKINPKLRITLK